jgi:hypothetical protein
MLLFMMKRALVVFFCLGVIVSVVGCKSTPNSQALINPDTGKHADGWITAHPAYYIADPTQCTDCHGTDLRGGITRISCFSADLNGVSCHALGPAGHPANWALPAQHGAMAKNAPSRIPISGFSTCQLCHGTDLLGGSVGISCKSCHTSAPHPTAWLPTSTYKHNTTDQANAQVCADCHANGANSPIPAPPTPPAGTPIGCFNNTLCHSVLHPAGWSSPSQHGASAKAAPNASAPSGFSVCQTCHGNDFKGGTALQTCLNTAACHGTGVMSPHPSSWSPDSTYKHNTTNQANAPVCALCHQSNPGTPGCFNNTLCHGNPG